MASDILGKMTLTACNDTCSSMYGTTPSELTGKPINADQARTYGLVNQVVEAGELLNTAGKLAATLARSAPIAMKGILEAVVSGSDENLAQGLELEADLFVGLCETDDMREGTAAFLEKRKPEFKGR